MNNVPPIRNDVGDELLTKNLMEDIIHQGGQFLGGIIFTGVIVNIVTPQSMAVPRIFMGGGSFCKNMDSYG